MAGWGNSQTQLWSREAIYVANRLGDAAPPVEINILANILTTTAEYEQAETFLKKIANKSSADVADKVVAQMTIGSLELQLGKPNDAETYFEAAKKSITSEANYTQGYINNRLANVEIVWASGLVTADCKAAKQHLASAGTYLSKAGPYEKSSANQLSVMNQFMTVACPDEAPTHR